MALGLGLQKIKRIVESTAKTQLGALIILAVIIAGFIYSIRHIPKILAIIIFLIVLLAVLRALAI